MSTTLQTPNTKPIAVESVVESSDVSERIAPKRALTLPKLSCLDQSLASMLTPRRRNGLQSLHMQFAAQMEQQRRKVEFEMPKKETGTVGEQPVSEPPMKRRRFQRRNSKTAAMLLSSMQMSTLVPDTLPDFSKNLADKAPNASDDTSPSSDILDGGLEIAEDLVRQLKLRRRNHDKPVP